MTPQPTLTHRAQDGFNTVLTGISDATQWVYSGGKDLAMKIYDLALPILKTMGEFLKGHFDTKTSVTAALAIVTGAVITAAFYQFSGNEAPANATATKKTA